MALPQPDPADPLRDALREWAQASAELAQTARDYLDATEARPGRRAANCGSSARVIPVRRDDVYLRRPEHDGTGGTGRLAPAGQQQPGIAAHVVHPEVTHADADRQSPGHQSGHSPT